MAAVLSTTTSTAADVARLSRMLVRSEAERANAFAAFDAARDAWARIDRLGNRLEDRIALDRALDPTRLTRLSAAERAQSESGW